MTREDQMLKVLMEVDAAFDADRKARRPHNARLHARIKAVIAKPTICRACEIEGAIGTEERPHPVPGEFHTCDTRRALSPGLAPETREARDEEYERNAQAITEVVQALAHGEVPPCECGNDAVCVGVTEGRLETLAVMCDECCGHGNENGWCVPLEKFYPSKRRPSPASSPSRWKASRDEAGDERDEALQEAASVIDTATFKTSTKAGNAARARGWLERWKHLPAVAREVLAPASSPGSAPPTDERKDKP